MPRPGERHYRVCVLGGTGFVGRHVVARLTRAGVDVVMPSRNPARHRDLLVVPGAQLVACPGFTPEALRPLLRGCAAVVNLIGILNERGHSGAGFHRAHAAVAASLVRACAAEDVGRIVQISALKASAERGPSHYLRSKGVAEQTIAASGRDGLAWTILQPSVICGPGDSFVNRFADLLEALPVLPLARPGAVFAPVFVGDVAAAVERVLRDDACVARRVELCGPETWTLREIVTFIRDELGLRRGIVPLPDFLGKLQAAVCDYLVPGKPFSLDNFRSLTVASTCTDNGLKRLGIEPRGFAGVAMTILAGRREDRLTRYRRTAGR